MEKREDIEENKKNAVAVVAIGNSKIWDISKKSIMTYCEKYNLTLEILTEEKYKIKPFDTFANLVNMFEKNQIYVLFEKYDRILRLDWDIIITPNCPNLFDIVPEDKFGGVYEDVGPAKSDRLKRMQNIQDQLGDLNWRSGYINGGVNLASKQHKEVFNTSLEEIQGVQKLKNIYSPEQDYLNYLIQKLGFEIYDLGYKFNHMIFFSAPWNGSPSRFDSYIIHYAGSKVFDKKLIKKRRKIKNIDQVKELVYQQMKKDYKKIFK